MFERFTDRARKVLALAQREAKKFNHEYVGTEHILLGLIEEGSGVASNVLRNAGIKLDEIRESVKNRLIVGPEMVSLTSSLIHKLPFTINANKVLDEAVEASRDMNHSYVGTEHILLGILRVEGCIAAEVLANAKVTVEEIRDEIVNLLGLGPELSVKIKPVSKTDLVFDLMYRGHKGQKRSNGKDYHTHPISVRDRLVRCGITDIDVLNTALCHDLLEDTSISAEEIESVAGKKVLEAVRQLTNLPPAGKSWNAAEKHANMILHAKEYGDIAKRVKLADRYDNLADAIWEWEPQRVKRYAQFGLDLLNTMQPIPVDIYDFYIEAKRFFSCLS